MSRLSATTRSADRGGARRFGALHRQADKWRFVVVEQDNGRTRLTHAESIRFGDVPAARAAVARHKVERVIRVAPAARTVCRLVEIPSGSPEEMAGAASLLAEAQLPGSAPAHRRGSGVIGGSSSPGRRNGLVVAWLGESDEPVVDAARESWTSEIVALASLVPGGRSGQALYADRESGSIAVFAVSGSASVARTIREQGADEGEWTALVSHAIDETRESLGSAFDLEGRTGPASSVRLDPGARRAALDAAGASRGEHWLDEYGVALGAAMGYAGADASAEGLYTLQREARAQKRSLGERALAWVADPTRAVGVAAAALLLALLVPIGVNAVRVAVLNAKLTGIDEQLEGRESARDLDRRAAFLDELVKRRWPMTKLLAEVGGALPVGMEVESVTLDRGTRIQVRGEAGSLELANKAVATLNDSGVFTNAQLMQTRSTGAGKLEYRIEAEVARPFISARGVEDYSQDTLAVRMYGERARGFERPAGSVADAGEDEGSDTGSGSSSRSRSRERAGGPTFTGEATERTDTVEVPPALTDAEIEAMTRMDAMREVAKRSRAASTAASEEDRERLRNEVTRLREHARNAGGGE